jgi:hypothetical protein
MSNLCLYFGYRAYNAYKNMQADMLSLRRLAIFNGLANYGNFVFNMYNYVTAGSDRTANYNNAYYGNAHYNDFNYIPPTQPARKECVDYLRPCPCPIPCPVINRFDDISPCSPIIQPIYNSPPKDLYRSRCSINDLLDYGKTTTINPPEKQQNHDNKSILSPILENLTSIITTAMLSSMNPQTRTTIRTTTGTTTTGTSTTGTSTTGTSTTGTSTTGTSTTGTTTTGTTTTGTSTTGTSTTGNTTTGTSTRTSTEQPVNAPSMMMESLISSMVPNVDPTIIHNVMSNPALAPMFNMITSTMNPRSNQDRKWPTGEQTELPSLASILSNLNPSRVETPTDNHQSKPRLPSPSQKSEQSPSCDYDFVNEKTC